MARRAEKGITNRPTRLVRSFPLRTPAYLCARPWLRPDEAGRNEGDAPNPVPLIPMQFEDKHAALRLCGEFPFGGISGLVGS